MMHMMHMMPRRMPINIMHNMRPNNVNNIIIEIIEEEPPKIIKKNKWIKHEHGAILDNDELDKVISKTL